MLKKIKKSKNIFSCQTTGIFEGLCITEYKTFLCPQNISFLFPQVLLQQSPFADGATNLVVEVEAKKASKTKINQATQSPGIYANSG